MAATPARIIPTRTSVGKINVVLRQREGDAIQLTREPLPEMPAELKKLFEERK